MLEAVKEAQSAAEAALLRYTVMAADVAEWRGSRYSLRASAPDAPHRPRRSWAADPTGAAASAEAPAAIDAAQRWLRCIDSLAAFYERETPAQARFLVGFYGLAGGSRPAPGGERAAMLRLSARLEVPESSLYRWRSEAAAVLALMATQDGLIRPFRLLPKSNNEK